MKCMVECYLFEEPVNITHALEAVASQDDVDGYESDLMVQAADYIRKLERQIKELMDEADIYDVGELKEFVGELKEFEDFCHDGYGDNMETDDDGFRS